MTDINENIAELNRRIARITTEYNIGNQDILLVAVTKTRSPEEINAAIASGITDIGENKVQEILDKYDQVQPVKWHMIGHLQTNKVKYIIDKVIMIHSVDSFKLAEEIDRRAAQAGCLMDILIQINAASEATKYGVTAEESENLIREIIQRCPHIRIKGLMFIAPFESDAESVRPYFKIVHTLFDQFRQIFAKELDLHYLSMGMSHDYEVAITEGSNMIRIGTAIFGDRHYQL